MGPVFSIAAILGQIALSYYLRLWIPQLLTDFLLIDSIPAMALAGDLGAILANLIGIGLVGYIISLIWREFTISNHKVALIGLISGSFLGFCCTLTPVVPIGFNTGFLILVGIAGYYGSNILLDMFPR